MQTLHASSQIPYKHSLQCWPLGGLADLIFLIYVGHAKTTSQQLLLPIERKELELNPRPFIFAIDSLTSLPTMVPWSKLQTLKLTSLAVNEIRVDRI